MSNLQKVLFFIEQEKLNHIGFLKNQSGFPGECVLSTHLLASYINQTQKTHAVSIVYGTVGRGQFFHSWLECEGVIIDFTLFQFLTYKERKSFYSKTSAEDMYQYIIKQQGTIFMDEFYPLREFYSKLTIIEPLFSKYVKENYVEFLKTVEHSPEFNDSWYFSPLQKQSLEEKTFKDFMNNNQLRLGKKNFTKWCILKSA